MGTILDSVVQAEIPKLNSLLREYYLSFPGEFSRIYCKLANGSISQKKPTEYLAGIGMKDEEIHETLNINRSLQSS